MELPQQIVMSKVYLFKRVLKSNRVLMRRHWAYESRCLRNTKCVDLDKNTIRISRCNFRMSARCAFSTRNVWDFLRSFRSFVWNVFSCTESQQVAWPLMKSLAAASSLVKTKDQRGIGMNWTEYRRYVNIIVVIVHIYIYIYIYYTYNIIYI